jgi:hypothetical protein
MSSNSLPSYEPTEFSPGETIEWRKSLTDFSAAEGWALTYYFRNAGGSGFNVAASADGSSWKVSAAVPTGTDPGRIEWEAWVQKDSEQRVVGRGWATVRPSLRALSASDNFDGRTQAEKDLDAVRAALVPASATGVQEYEIGGVGSSRRVRYFSKAELLELEKTLAQRVNRERRAAAHRRGAPYFKTVR